jgi:ATP-dependent Clp protease ATP-binding subunit ClpC
LEDGSLTDAKGVKVDFRNTIIIMTSNIGADRLNKEVKLGFVTNTRNEIKELDREHAKNSEMIIEDVRKRFKPEFLNRLDKLVVFNALCKGDIKKIVNLQLAELSERLKEKKITLKVTEGAKSVLVERGYDPDNGARPLRRTIQNLIEDPLANGILNGEFKEGDVISALKDKENLKLYVLEAAK